MHLEDDVLVVADRLARDEPHPDAVGPIVKR
jgi:hypothetical protein